MKKYALYIVVIIFSFITGCEKIIDIKPESAITNANYWKAEGDVVGYLTGIYAKYRDVMNTTYYLEDRADEFVSGLEGGMSTAWQQNLTPQNAPSWLDFYNVVHHCNLILKYAPGIPFNQEADRNRILAQTRFIRAHIYFTLLRSWGNVPIVTAPTENADREMPARAGAPEVMQFILTDINEAIGLFPERGYKDKDLASMPAAYALKADALLWKAKVLGGGNEDLNEVLNAADSASEGLALEEIFSGIFNTETKNGKEVIFSLHFAKDEKSDQYGSRLKPRDIFVQTALNKNDIAFAVSGARSQYAPSDKLQQAFASSDQRRSTSFISAVEAGNKVIGVFDNKMRGSLHPDNRYYDNDIIIYRLAEMILFKAEALAALNRTADAVIELNKVKQRAGIPGYSGSMDRIAVEKEILNERFRELYLELKRWPDLLRFHSGGTINVRTEVTNMNQTIPLFFPIPQAQIDINPNLSQTEGY